MDVWPVCWVGHEHVPDKCGHDGGAGGGQLILAK